MEMKSSRGIQQEDVWRAADALIAEGLRPTIERVRLKIGRGSPNTVSPLLEGWFATLGQRLRVIETTDGAGTLPALVLTAATELWNVAQQSAQEDASKAFDAARDALDREQTSLQAEQQNLKIQEQVLNERHLALNESLNTARVQISDLNNRLKDSNVLLAQRDRQVEELRSHITELEKLRDAERHQKDEQAKNHLDERRRFEERAAINERRLLVELDRERQEIKRNKAALFEAEKNADQLMKTLQESHESLEARLQTSQAELLTAQQALVSANDHASEFRALIEMQSTVNRVAQKQINLRVASSQRKKSAMVLPKRRRI